MMRSFLFAALLAAPAALAEEPPCVPVKPCEAPEAGPGAAPEAPAELGADARRLFDLLSCRGAPPEGLDPAAVKAFCARQAPLAARAAEARAALQALLQPLRPARLPSAAVYPFSGADLLGALAVYPEARNTTLVTGRPAGDVRVLGRLRDRAALVAFLGEVAGEAERLVRAQGGERPPAGPAARTPTLPLLLWALAVDGLEPVGLRYLRVEPAGTLRYLAATELSAGAKGGPDPFASCELGFVRRGEPAGTLPRTVRSLEADLSDAGVAADPGPLAHLGTKGSFAAVLADAGALAGDRHARLRELLLRRAAFTVSDGTGPAPEQLRQAGLAEESRPRPGGAGKVVVIRRK